MKIPFTYINHGVNLNTLKDPGIYCIAGSCTNAPNTNHCMVLVQNGGCGTAFQLFMGDVNNEICKRHTMDTNGNFTGD